MSAPDCLLKISVIIPTWNRAQIIRRAISSALGQTYPPFEILVCDDGSTDNTEELVRDMGDPRIRWIAGEHTGRPAIPRNRGIAVSKGGLIAFLDSDDYWQPEKLEAQVSAMERLGVRAICTNAYRDTEQSYAPLISWDKERLSFTDLLSNNRVVCSSVLIERSILDDAEGFPEATALRVGEDYALWLKASKTTQFGYLDAPLVVYKDDPTNSVRAKGPSITIQQLRVFSHYLAMQAKRTPPGAIYDFLKIGLVFCISYGKIALHLLLTVVLKWRRRLIRRAGPAAAKTAQSMPPHFPTGDRNGKSPAVSVILPTHNAINYLRLSIDSILCQTYRDFELIVVDDGSGDGTSVVLSSYVDPRIVRLVHAKSSGIVSALNGALAIAKGTYIARMDADDIALPDRLQKQVRYLDTHPDIAIVGSWIRGFGSVRRPYIHHYPLSNVEIQVTQYFENPFAHPSVMIRRTMLAQLEQASYSAKFPLAEDWELWGRLFKVGAAANIPMPLINYRIHSANLSKRYTGTQKASIKRLLEQKYAKAGLPFCPEFVIDPPRSDAQWLQACYSYFHELQQSVEKRGLLDPIVFAKVLQQQLTQRVMQMSWLGIYPLYFILAYPLTKKFTLVHLSTALRAFVIINARALLACKNKFR